MSWLRQQFSPLSLAIIGALIVVVSAIIVATLIPAITSTTAAVVALLCATLLALFAVRSYRRHWDKDQPHGSVSATNLAIALIGGAVIGLFLFGSQLALQVGAEERNFRLLMGVSRDLTGFSPPRDEDGDPMGGPYSLEGVHLRGKVLALAHLSGTKLSHSNLEFTNLSGASMVRADLRDARMRSSYAYYLDLRCACLQEARLHHADLRNADLRGADLRDANLTGADLRGALTDTDTRFDGAITDGWCRDPEDTDCASEARNTHERTAPDDADLRDEDPGYARDCDPIS
jgi:hypothetical protein